MLEEKIPLRNYAHIGDAVWDVFVREYAIFQTSNAKVLHKMTTDRVNAVFQKDLLHLIENKLTVDETELARRARNLPIPIGRRSIQKDYRQSTAFRDLIISFQNLKIRNFLIEFFFFPKFPSIMFNVVIFGFYW